MDDTYITDVIYMVLTVTLGCGFLALVWEVAARVVTFLLRLVRRQS